MRDRKIKVLGKEEMRLRGVWAAVRRKEKKFFRNGELSGVLKKTAGEWVLLYYYIIIFFLFPLFKRCVSLVTLFAISEFVVFGSNCTTQ